MLERITEGDIPQKPHLAHYVNQELCHEHCITRDGFDGPFTIQYHISRPQALVAERSNLQYPTAVSVANASLARHHFSSESQHSADGNSVAARIPLLFNSDVQVSRVRPTVSNDTYLANGDGDTLLFVQSGRGMLISAFGHLPFEPADYLFIPKGIPHRFDLGIGPHDWFELELSGGTSFPPHYVNRAGQLRMDAPFSHRDFKKSRFQGPLEEGLRTVLVKSRGRLAALQYDHSPLDVVGFDGCVYPFVLPVHAFQPKVSSVHLPPTIHASFTARGVLVCNFVPRPLDFHPQAIPCPYPHSSGDVDEVLFYSDGEFSSRRGVAAGSITWHPRGLPHGPHPWRYEESIGRKQTRELAIMLDCIQPLDVNQHSLQAEDPAYEQSFS